jgi:hypothetical protein
MAAHHSRIADMIPFLARSLVANSNTCMRTPNEELVKACFPGVKYNATSGPNDSLLSIEKAKRELGYKPKYDWK